MLLRRRPRLWLLPLPAFAAAWLVPGPTRWLWKRVSADQAVLNVVRPAYKVGPGERVMLVSPHLDDETLGAGGLLAHLSARKIPLRVVFLTNGDGSGSTILALNFGHGRRFSFVESALVRQKEALAALGKLGVAPREVAFLGYPDGDLQTLWDRWDGAPIRSRFTHLSRVPYANAPSSGSPFKGANLLRDLASQMEAFHPTRVLSTHGADAHPDHWSADAFARLALQVLAERHAGPRSRPQVEHDGFVIHHGIFPLPHGFHPEARLNLPSALAAAGTSWRDFELSDSERAAKGTALEEYRSQLVFTPNYLRAFVRRNEPLGQAEEFQAAGSWRDESQESWALAKDPGADVQVVRVRARPDSLEIEESLASMPSSNVLYALNIKSIFARGRVLARRFDVRAQGSQLVARELGGRQVHARKSPRGFTLELRWSALGAAGAERPRRVVVDASSWSGTPEDGAMLDRTESRSVRLD